MSDPSTATTTGDLTIERVTATFTDVVEGGTVETVLWADELHGAEIAQFPNRGGRPADPLHRAAMLRLLRSTVGDLMSRPDLELSGHAWFFHPSDSGTDLDLVYDVVVSPGDLDFGDRPAVALCRFALHRNFGFGVDADGIYVGQRVLVGVDVGGREPDVRLLAATLSLPIDVDHTLTELPSGDVRDDLDALRERVWREHVWRALAGDAGGSED